MASTSGEAVGASVGYRVRFGSKVSRATRIEVVTEGIFTRLVLEDPALAGVAAVLFDEPLTVIDPELKWQLRSKLKALHRELDLTMIYVTHDQTEALTFADTAVVMHDGRVVQSGTPAELFDKPAHTFVGYFIGSPGMNIVPAQVSGHEAKIDGHVIGLHRNYGALPSGARIEIVSPNASEKCA